jgi:hypothetical protein
MARDKVRLDSKGIQAIAKSAFMQNAVKLKTEQVAIKVRGMGIRVGGFKGDVGEIDLPVETDLHITDRAHGTVTLAHPAGEAVQAKHGALTKAAAQAGLEVKDKR